MSCEVIVRRARSNDLQRRMELVRKSMSGYFWSAFMYFFFQELTLECCVLGAAVLFIFFGVSASTCVSIVPAAAALVAFIVSATHHSLAYKQAQKIKGEIFGLVAEVCGVLLLSPGTGQLPIHILLDIPDTLRPAYSLVVGTVSVSEYQGLDEDGWLHALVVHPDWRRRGVGGALVDGARRAAAARGSGTLRAVLSLLQTDARRALLSAGWRGAGSYERPLCGAALTLPMEKMTASAPPAHREL